MRTKNVTINGKSLTVKEKRVIELKNDVLPKVFNVMDGVELKDMETLDLIPLFAEKVSEFFPELSPEDVENAYPSEIEALIAAFIEVNFGGLKKMLPLVSGLLKTALPKLQ